MKRILIAILALLISITQLTYASATYAYWNNLESINSIYNMSIPVGTWEWGGSTPLDNAPAGTVDLDPLVESNSLNLTLNNGDYFLFEGKLYRVTSSSGYNMQWHGLPDGSAAGWAFLSFSLDWIGAQQRYSTGAVIRVDGRYFQAMHQGNLNNPLTNHGPSSSGKPWREIQPMTDNMFPLIPGTTLRDYTNPYTQYVIEKY